MSELEALVRKPPIIAIVGASKSGKTSLMEGLVASLTAKGYGVATIKHALENPSFDREHKDSWRHIQAGSKATLLVSAGQAVLIKPTNNELNLEEAVQLLGSDYDIVLAEGFKGSHVPKIKVCKSGEKGDTSDLTNLIAVVSQEPVGGQVKRFSPHEIDQLADFIQQNFLRPQTQA
jgi:molybdopterin-guanine dinucleotide biosynthesis protein B